jgi:aminoglycoside phosphotransferase (APT) family kinase protein
MTMREDPAARIDAVFPQIGAGAVRPMGTGWAAETFDVDGAWVVQFARDDEAADKLRRQIDTLPELAAELSALVPEPVFADRGVPAIAYRRLDGVALDRAPDGLWPERLGRFLYDLHLMPPEYVGLRGATASGMREALGERLAWMRSDVVPLLTADEAKRCEERFDAFLGDDDLWRFAPCLTHGDIGPEHVLVSHTGDLVGVLDWEALSVDDPAADFAWLLHARPGDGERALGAYGGAPDQRFRSRAAFLFWLMPFHEVAHGLRTEQRAFVDRGLQGIRSRFDVVLVAP